ncbi:MAG: 23S rRNA (adenine(2503)-C(2))-methyltransferase RlmN [Clostridia bacterium]|nr:23S rRNA (adenine(2503)-C(2))-methyltransferase RlmN [Clostridia bacterium]
MTDFLTLLDLDMQELTQYVTDMGYPKFRATQVFDAMYQGKELSEITTLPRDLLEKIKDKYPSFSIVKRLESKDGTKKYVYRFADGEIVEGVFMRYKYGNTLCVSTQVGCRMGCKFCASGLYGLKRNLSAGEILQQIVTVNRDNGGDAKNRSITNVVLMGSGEPLDNYDNVTKFFRLVTSERGLNISQRNISLSTCGLVPNIYRLADDGFSVTLTISLHAPNDEIRQKTMPIANKYSVKEILDACKYYFDKTGRRVVFEYTLVDGLNDTDYCVKELGRILHGFPTHVNVIPLNFVKERGLKGSPVARAHDFAKKLNDSGVSATVRRTLGADIGGACGQLRNKLLDPTPPSP